MPRAAALLGCQPPHAGLRPGVDPFDAGAGLLPLSETVPLAALTIEPDE
jgi:hypothetical protein